MNQPTDEARLWAENLAESEGEAFEQAIKRIKPNEEPKTASKMLTMPLNVSDEIEQAIKRISPQKVIDALTDENATLRIQVARLNDENRKLREAVRRQSMDNYEYE